MYILRTWQSKLCSNEERTNHAIILCYAFTCKNEHVKVSTENRGASWKLYMKESHAIVSYYSIIIPGTAHHEVLPLCPHVIYSTALGVLIKAYYPNISSEGLGFLLRVTWAAA